MLSLVTIVKNEEDNLLNMMSSASGLVDEFIIVDTGSTDNTVELAGMFGAEGQVKVFKWGPSDNFAEPRNFGLRRAQGEWILHLDADDILLEQGKETIKALLEMPLEGFNGYCFQILEDCEEPYMAPSSGRLFPKHLQWRYKGHVHMEIQAPGLGWVLCQDGPHILHHGYATRAIRVMKLQRNIRLLMLDIKDDPHDTNAMYYLAISYKDLGQEDEADNWARRALSIGGQVPWVRSTLLSCLKGKKLEVRWFNGTQS